LAYSPPGHENIGIAYANRSVIFMKQGFYKLAIENIQLARDNDYPKSKLEKLVEREERCLEMIHAGKSKEDSFQKNKNAKKKLLGERLPANKKFPFYIADCLTLEKSDAFGNHMRTKQDLKTGTLVASERQLAATLMPSLSFERCEYCKNRNELNLIPCKTCTRVVYCSEKCRQEAFESYHKYICGLDRALPFAVEEVSVLKLFCFGLNLFENPTEFFEFLRETEDSDATGWDVDFSGMNEKEINKNLFLVMNSFKETNQFLSRPLSELYVDYKKIAYITATVLNCSKLKDVLVTEEQKAAFRNFVLRQTKIIPAYYFQWSSFFRCEPYCENVCYGTLSLTNFFNNSCAPNVHVFLEDSKVLFHTVRPIKKGEQLFIGYGATHLENPVKVRQANLKKERGYVCKCEACEQPHKYPLEDNLQVKDRSAFCHSPRAQREMSKMIQERDVDAAIKQFPLICDYLDAHERIHPSYETNQMNLHLLMCMMVFCACDEIKKIK
jgi:hypothetical protein